MFITVYIINRGIFFERFVHLLWLLFSLLYHSVNKLPFFNIIFLFFLIFLLNITIKLIIKILFTMFSSSYISYFVYKSLSDSCSKILLFIKRIFVWSIFSWIIVPKWYTITVESLENLAIYLFNSRNKSN